MDNLIRQGKVVRGYLGVINPQTLSPGLAKSLGFPEDTTGVLVADVASDSPAQRAGLQSGDVIAEISGRKLNDERSLRLMVAQTPPGSHVDLRVLRATTGQKATQCLLAARLAEMPSDLQASASPSSPRSTTRPRSQSNFDCLDGVEVADLDPHTRHQLELPANLGGALVVNVDGDCNAADAGLRPGDVILEIDRHPVANADAAVELCDKARGELLLLRLWSRPPKGGSGSAHFLSVDNLKHK
jgi:serine protease Do